MVILLLHVSPVGIKVIRNEKEKKKRKEKKVINYLSLYFYLKLRIFIS